MFFFLPGCAFPSLHLLGKIQVNSDLKVSDKTLPSLPHPSSTPQGRSHCPLCKPWVKPSTRQLCANLFCGALGRSSAHVSWAQQCDYHTTNNLPVNDEWTLSVPKPSSVWGKTHCFKIRVETSLVVQWSGLHFPVQGVWVQSLFRKLRSHTSPKSQNIKQKQYCNKFGKDFKQMVHIKKNNNPKKIIKWGWTRDQSYIKRVKL